MQYMQTEDAERLAHYLTINQLNATADYSQQMAPPCLQEYIRRGKESILLCIGVCKHPLKSTKVKLTITTSINSTVE